MHCNLGKYLPDPKDRQSPAKIYITTAEHECHLHGDSDITTAPGNNNAIYEFEFQ